MFTHTHCPNFTKFGPHFFELADLGIWDHPRKWRDISLTINKSDAHTLTVLKFGKPVCYETPETVKFRKSTSGQIQEDQDGR